MTEQDWLTSEDPKQMLASAQIYMNIQSRCDRKLWLFVAAVEREWWGDKASKLDIRSMKLLEALADGKINWASEGAKHIHFSYSMPHHAVACALECIRLHNSKGDPPRWAGILREVTGNPWKPPGYQRINGLLYPRPYPWQELAETIEPISWSINPNVLNVAQKIYEESDWEGMPVLADALEDAGCDDTEILMHLRGKERCWAGCDRHGWQMIIDPGRVHSPTQCPTCKRTGWIPLRNPHVRGCHALDLVLNKEQT